MSKRPLQIVTAALGLIPVVTGAIAMLGVDDPLYASIGLPRSALLDSNLRFFAGVWVGLGIALLWVVPSIERQGTLFRVVWGRGLPRRRGPPPVDGVARRTARAFHRLHHPGDRGRARLHVLAASPGAVGGEAK